MDALLRRIACACMVACALSLSAPTAFATPRSIEAGDITFEALSPQQLTAGRCGLFLWAKGDEPMFLATALDQPAEVRVRANGRNRDLHRTEFSGRVAFGHFETQTYTDGRLTMTLDVHFDLDKPLRGGALVDRGVVRVTDDAGWETVVPVGGMIACMS